MSKTIFRKNIQNKFRIALLTGGPSLDSHGGLCLSLLNSREVAADLREFPVVAVSMLVFTVYGTIDSLVAAYLGHGDITLLAYSQRLTIAVCGVVITGVGAVALPRFAVAFNKGDMDAFASDVVNTVRGVFLCIALLAVAVGVWAPVLLTLLFQAGRFSAESTSRLSMLMPFMLAGGVFMSCTTIVFRALYSINNVKQAAYAGCVGVFMYVALSVVGVRCGLSLYSFAGAYIISWASTLGLALIPLIKLWRSEYTYKLTTRLWGVLSSLLICMLCAAVMAKLILFPVSGNPVKSILYLLLCSGLLLIVYIVSLSACVVPEARAIKKYIECLFKAWNKESASNT